MPYGKQSRITHIGSVQLTPALLLSNVLHVSEFQFNFLSVSKLCNQLASKVIFTSIECTLQGPMSQEVVFGRASSEVYQVQHSTTKVATTANGSRMVQKGNRHNKTCFSDGDSWHFSLGHLSFDKMKQFGLSCNKGKS